MSRIVEVDEGDFERIQAKAFERYVLQLMQGWATEQERLHLKNRGKEYNWQIREVSLEGEYPDTCIRITKWDRRRNQEFVDRSCIWKEFFGKEPKPPNDEAVRIAGDILMLARGG